MKKITKVLSILMLAAFSFSCSNLFDESKFTKKTPTEETDPTPTDPTPTDPTPTDPTPTDPTPTDPTPTEVPISDKVVDFEKITISKSIGNGAFKNASILPVVINGFNIAQKETTYVEWYTVYQWAIKNGYTIPDAGCEGSANAVANKVGIAPSSSTSLQPVTYVSWRSVLVWCNAASEKAGLDPVYYVAGTTDFTDKTKVLRVAEDISTVELGKGAAEKCVVNHNSLGYRLPTDAEWELAARGGDATKKDWSYTYAGSNTLSEVGWYTSNSTATHNVGELKPNALGLYDMCGNVWEWIYIENQSLTEDRHYRGGSYWNAASYCEVDYIGGYLPQKMPRIGFRLCRSTTKQSNTTPTPTTTAEIGDYDKTNFTSSRFSQLKDVFWNVSNNPTTISNTKYPYNADTESLMSSSDWTSDAYVTLTKVATISASKVYGSGKVFGVDCSGKTVPVYKVTYHKGTTSKVIASQMVILGISEDGMMTISRRSGTGTFYYGTFYYTNKGWSRSSKGTAEIKATMDVVYPTETELNAQVAKY